MEAACALIISIASVHLMPGDFNYVNPGVGAQCSDIEVIAYKNSYSAISVAALYSPLVANGVRMRVGVVAGYTKEQAHGFYPFAPVLGFTRSVGVVRLGLMAPGVITFEMKL